MKKLFTILAVAAAMVSCAKEEVVSFDQGEAIEFGSFVDNATRANQATDPSLTASTLTSFNVYGTVGGVAIYSGAEVTGKVGDPNSGSDYIWTCASVKQYWIKDAVYKFAALKNEGAETNLTFVDNLPATVQFDATAANVDLLYAKNYGADTDDDGVEDGIIGKASNNGPVNFTFEHLLSKVKFTVNNNSTSATGYSFEVNNIVVTGAKTGKINLADKTWSNKSAAAPYSVGAIAVAEGDAKEESAVEMLLIPGDFTVSFKVDIFCQDTKIATHESAVSTHTLVGGNAYNFTIGVAVGEEITFAVTQAPQWGNGNTHDSDDVDNVNDYIPLQ